MTTVAQFLGALRSQLGVTERPPGSNCQPYSAALGRPCEPWCADFLIARADAAGLALPGRSAYTPALANAFKQAGRWGTTPLVGAFGFIYYPSKGRIAHVFVVEAVEPDGHVITIEGNTDIRGGRSGGRVMRHRRSLHNVPGFGYPEFTRRAAPAPRDTSRPAPPAPDPEDDDVRRLVKLKDKPPVFITDGITRRWVTTQAELKELVEQKLADPRIEVVNAAFLDAIPPVGLEPPQ